MVKLILNREQLLKIPPSFSKLANFAGGAQFSGPTTTFASDAVYQGSMAANDMTIQGTAVFSGTAIYNNELLIDGDIQAGQNMEVAKELVVQGDVALNKDVTVAGNLIANYPDGSIPASAITGEIDISGNLTITGSLDVTENIGIKNPEPVVSLDLSGCTDAIRLPVGTTDQRPESTDENHHGYIRYNTETSQFEGFGAGNAWGSLGGVDRCR